MREESFVVRIYRKAALPAPMRRAEGARRGYDRMAVSGVVEIVERAEQRAFHDIEELWGILAGTAGDGGKATVNKPKT